LKVSLIVNPVAGNRAYRSIKKIEALLKEKVSLQTFITQRKGEATAFARELSDTDLIIVAGGDGTFNEVINGVLSFGESISDKIPLAFIPLGTTNVLAKELGIPESIEKSIYLALTGTPRKISVGRILITRHPSPVMRYFCLMAGIGFDGETVLGVKNNIIKKISGKGAHILSGIKTLIGYNPPLLKIKTPKGELTGYTAVIGKASCYGGYFKVTPRARLTEPMLDLCVLKSRGRKDLLRFIIGIIRKKHLNFKDVLYDKFTELEITSAGTVHVQIDGDYFGTLPVKIDVVQDVISLIW